MGLAPLNCTVNHGGTINHWAPPGRAPQTKLLLNGETIFLAVFLPDDWITVLTNRRKKVISLPTLSLHILKIFRKFLNLFYIPKLVWIISYVSVASRPIFPNPSRTGALDSHYNIISYLSKYNSQSTKCSNLKLTTNNSLRFLLVLVLD